MRALGVEAIYPKPNLSPAVGGQTRYPYLLKGLLIDRANQVWSTEITYSSDGEGVGLSRGYSGLV